VRATKKKGERRDKQLLKVNVKLSLYLINYALCHEGILGKWRYSSTILDLGTRWKAVYSFTLPPLYRPGKSLPAPIG
jgi:hypothetical protein